ncbi:MAG: hypothetical protein H0U16_01475, partial [Actinobacteria bacterium]|nr:hypothetical protein [Actinomycetota bacterium]
MHGTSCYNARPRQETCTSSPNTRAFRRPMPPVASGWRGGWQSRFARARFRRGRHERSARRAREVFESVASDARKAKRSAWRAREVFESVAGDARKARSPGGGRCVGPPKRSPGRRPKRRTTQMSNEKTYADKRSFDKTPEPAPAVSGNVDPGRARPGPSFLIHQHHARRLHFDLRLEMMNGDTPVLVSWAVPKNLPIKKGKPHLAVHVEDHPFEYGSFSGTIPAGEYGAGEVRIFDSGSYEILEQEAGKLSLRLLGRRFQGIWHLTQTRKDDGKDEWLVFLRRDERPPPDDPPTPSPMLASTALEAFDDDAWLFEP